MIKYPIWCLLFVVVFIVFIIVFGFKYDIYKDVSTAAFSDLSYLFLYNLLCILALRILYLYKTAANTYIYKILGVSFFVFMFVHYISFVRMGHPAWAICPYLILPFIVLWCFIKILKWRKWLLNLLVSSIVFLVLFDTLSEVYLRFSCSRQSLSGQFFSYL